MPITIVSGDNSGNTQTIDSSNAARVTLYGADGAEITKMDKTSSITPGTTRGTPSLASDYKVPRLLRVNSDGALTTGRTLELFDRMEGAAYNSNKWIQTLTTMTMTQATGALTFNAGSSFATTVGALLTSHKFFPFSHRQTLTYRTIVSPGAHFSNNLIELGFGIPTSATAAGVVNGAIWRKDGTGQWIPVLSINGSENFGTGISNATFIAAIPVGQYAIFEVNITNAHIEYSIYNLSGTLQFSQIVDWPASTAGFAATRLSAMLRIYNSASTGTAVQMIATDISVLTTDFDKGRMWAETQAGNAEGGIVTSPTAYTQIETYANNAAPATATPSNTAAAIGTLGGHAAWNNAGTSFAASDALDLIIFGAAVSSPYGMMIKGIHLDSVNLGAANGAAIYTLEWFLSVNSSALSLATAAPYSPMKKVLGFQTLANAAAIGQNLSPRLDVVFNAGIYVFPSRFVVIGCRVIGASVATASQVIRTSCTLDGYFE